MERVASPRLVGRQAEMQALQATLEQLGSGRTAAVLLGGEAGVGKSRLVREFAAAAADTGHRVLTGGCVALGAENLAYAPFTQALGELTAELGPAGVEALVGPARVELARLVPELRLPGDDHRPAGASDRGVLFQVVLRALANSARSRPLVLVIEDLHWADTSSRELMSFLISRLREPVLIVATYRSDDVHRRHPLRPFLAEAARDERVLRLELGPLEPAEVAQQIEAILGSPPGAATVKSVVSRAQGNPFFVEELVAAQAEHELPPGLAEVLAARLAALPQAVQELVAMAAVAGPRVGHELLATVAARTDIDASDGVREAISHHVLVAEPTGAYAFRHALLQEAAYAELLPAERATMHGAYADALAAHPEWATIQAGMASELAHHYLAAKDVPRALHASVAAAAAAAETYAFAEAHALCEQALALWGQVPNASQVAGCDHVELLQRAADAAQLAGAAPRSITLVRTALNQLDAATEPARAALLHWRLARLLWISGEGEESMSENHAAVMLIPTEPSAERALILAAEGHVLMLSDRYQESAARCEEAIAVAHAAGARREEGYALNTLGADLSLMAQHERAVAMLEQSLAIAEEVGSIEDVWRAHINLVAALGYSEQLERAVVAAREGAARLEDLGYEEGAAALRCVGAVALLESGSWDEADRLAAQTVDAAPIAMSLVQAKEVRGMIALRRGDYVAAHRHLEAARAISTGGYPGFLANVLAALAELTLAEGLVDEARSLVEEGLEGVVGTDNQVAVLRLVALGLRVEGDARTRKLAGGSRDRLGQSPGRVTALIERARTMSAYLVHRGMPTTRRGQAFECLCEAELARAEDRHAAELWCTTAKGWTEISHPFEAAYARWREAEALLATGAKDEAVRALREAYSTASRLGAASLVANIAALARRARVRVTATASEPSASRGSLGLTEREAEVLALVAAGNTNRQIAEALFMSDKTASVHVSRILSKLGVANRGQAAAVAHRVGLVAE